MALTSLTNLQPLHVHSVGVSTFDGSVSVGGTLTYEDVTNVDAIGIVTARSGVNVSGGQLDVGSNIKLGNAGVITATSFVGSGANLTGITQTTINSNTNNYLITGTGTANTLQGESQLTYDGQSLKNLFSVTGATPITAEFRNTASTWGGGVRFKSNNTYGTVEITNYDGSANASIFNSTGGWHWTANWQTHGNVSPWTDGNLTLGTSSKKWQHTYTGSINGVLHITSSNNVGINESSPTAMLHVNTSHYVPTSSGKSTSGIHLDGNPGNAGEYGGGISLSCGNSSGSSAAIAARQMTSDSDVIGLSFFTHDSSTGTADAVEKVRIYDGGATCFNNGIVLGNGLTYDADHLMDDYEEGSYTPVVQTDNGVNCGMAVAQGYYVKVGKLVTVHLKIQTNSHSSVNTAAQYKVSLPYTSMATGDTQGTLMCSIWSIGSSAISWMGGQVHNNNAWTHLAYHNGNNNNTNNLQPNNANNQLQFRGTVVYRSNS